MSERGLFLSLLPFAAVSGFILYWWATNPEMTQMQVFIRWWWLIVLGLLATMIPLLWRQRP